MIHFITDNAQEFLTFGLLVSTIVYTWATIRMYKESVKIREIKNTPFLIAYLKKENYQTDIESDLIIKNIGEGLGKDVSASIKAFIIDWETKVVTETTYLCEVGIFTKGLNIFPPHHELRYSLGSFVNRDEGLSIHSLEIDIKYKNNDNKDFTKNYPIQLEQYNGQSTFRSDTGQGLHNILREEQMEKRRKQWESKT